MTTRLARRPRAGDPYDPAAHPFEVLAPARLGVSYQGLTLGNAATFRPVLEPMAYPLLARARSGKRARRP